MDEVRLAKRQGWVWGFFVFGALGCAQTVPGPDDPAATFTAESALCAAPTLTINPLGPVAQGTLVNLSAAASCTGPAQFQFYARAPGAAGYTLLRAYGASSYDWDTSALASGQYTLLIYARQVGSASVYDAAISRAYMVGSVCTVAGVSATSGAGGVLDLSGSATCSSGATPEFRFLDRPPGAATFTQIRSFGGASFTWDPSGLPSGMHTLQVYARAAGNASAYEAVGSRAVLVGGVCSSVTLSVTPGAGSILNLSAVAGCSAGVTPELQFLVRAPGATTYAPIRGFATGNSFAWDTAGLPAGLYNLGVYARGVGNASSYESTSYVSYRIGNQCPSATLSAAPGSGATVNLTATAGCSAGATPEFRFLARAPGATAYTQLRAYGAGNFAWDTTGLPSGQYTLLVYTRAAGNLSSYEGSAARSYLVGNVCATAAISATAGAGAIVNLSATAGCSATSTPEYRFLDRLPGTTTYTEIRPYGPATYGWDTTGLPSGQHTLQVQVRAAGNSSAFEALATRLYLVGAACSSAALSVAPGVGTRVDITASAVCSGGATPEFRILGRAPGEPASTQLRDYGGPTLSWDTAGHPSGTYVLQAYARGVGNLSTYESVVTQTFLVACGDGRRNGFETDVDCGGVCSTGCANSRLCSRASDCASGVCTAGRCTASVCGDGARTGSEACDDGNTTAGDGCSPVVRLSLCGPR